MRVAPIQAQLRQVQAQRATAEQDMQQLTQQLALIREFVLSNRQSLCVNAERSARVSLLEQTFCDLSDTINEINSPESNPRTKREKKKEK